MYDIPGIISGKEAIPLWVIIMISLSLGLGTMVGWKRIVVTIGEKIGKEKLTYAQATVASIMTAITIQSASYLHLPVSTTHIMSSGVAGTMAHEHGKHGLQGNTIKSILMAWVLTLPVSTVLAGAIFWILQAIFVRYFDFHSIFSILRSTNAVQIIRQKPFAREDFFDFPSLFSILQDMTQRNLIITIKIISPLG